jgi:hypothetical protein
VLDTLRRKFQVTKRDLAMPASIVLARYLTAEALEWLHFPERQARWLCRPRDQFNPPHRTDSSTGKMKIAPPVFGTRVCLVNVTKRLPRRIPQRLKEQTHAYLEERVIAPEPDSPRAAKIQHDVAQPGPDLVERCFLSTNGPEHTVPDHVVAL